MTIIGIDNIERKFKVQRSIVMMGQQPRVDSVNLPLDLIERGDYSQIFDRGLADYIAAFGPLPTDPVIVVLPDAVFSLDTIVLPTMPKRIMGETFRTEFENLYKNHEDLLSFAEVISTNKKNTVYLVTLIRKDLVSKVRDVLASRNLKLEKVISSAAARCECLTDQHARLHRDTYLFLDVMDNSSSIILYDKGRMFGFSSLPFGLNALPDDRTVDEYDLFDNDIADLAVINARERAKAAKLTQAQEEEVDPSILAGGADPSAMSKQDIMAMAQQMQEEEAAATAALIAAEAEDDEEEEEVAPVEAQPVVPQGKRYVKKPRRLPSYMLRPAPETPNATICENFRAFQVRLLNYVRTCKLTDTLPDPAYIVVNLPKEYEFLAQMLNAQCDNGISFKMLCADGHSNVLKDLEMHGASKLSTRSRNPIF